VSNTFFAKFNKGAVCDSNNKLSIILSCSGGGICVAQGLTPSCRTPGPCDPVQGIFGLGATVQSCEGTAGDENYCFLDRSSTSVDTCYTCSQALSCYDYKSEGACQRNNCGLGNCSWVDTFPDVGAGVCVDKRFNNCALCSKSGTTSAPNSGSYNFVFDQCSPEKAAALASDKYPCFYNNGTAQDCAGATCMDYTPAQCGSTGGIQLNPDNSIANPSSDPCGIKVCQYDPSVPAAQNPGCHKNADGTPLTSFWPDCGVNNAVCEHDYFPPLTTLLPVGSAGKFDFLNIRIWERSNATDFGHLILPPGDLSLSIGAPNSTSLGDRKEIPGWRTYFCASPQGGTACTTFVSVNSTQLNIHNLALQDGQKLLLNFSTGWNTLRFYTQDPNKNLEIMKNLSIYACSACQGPLVLSFNISPSRVFGGTYYTNSLTPTGVVAYNAPVEQVFAGFAQGSTTLGMSQTPSSGFNYNYALAMPSGSQLSEGTYTFSLNAKDNNNLYMNAPVTVPFIVDVTPPTATYIPANGTVLGSGPVAVTINFSEKVVVQNFTIVEYIVYDTPAGPIRVPQTRDITGLFTTSNNQTFKATLTLSDGKKILRPIVTDYAGNALTPATNSSTFIVNAQPPIITLLQPPFGVSSTFTFPFAVETDSVADCRYWSSQTLPPPGIFSALQPFDSTTGYVHKLNNFNQITQENTPFKVYVQCVDSVTGTGSENFFLSVDKSAPKIITAFAAPNPIVQMPLQTALKVQTDDLTFCRFSNSTTNYDLMEYEFPMFNILGMASHVINVTVSSPATHTFTIACKNLAGLGPVSKAVTFSVDLTQTLMLKSVTPAYIGNTSVPLGVESNKDTYCYYEQNGQLEPLGSTNGTSLAHSTLISVPGPGAYSIPVTCSTGSGTSAQGIEQKTINVTFFVDVTPPVMKYVNDTSNNPQYPEYSYLKNQLRVSMLGFDNESNVSRYQYLIQEKTTSVVLKNWTYSVILDGLPWWVTGLNLTNSTTYIFRAKSENRAALLSSEMPSDGVTIDFGKIPPQCLNQLLDGNETDIDCGGICPPCKDLLKCQINSDCVSRICNSTKICQPSRCDDKINGANETDIDCGGGTCLACANNRTCAVNEDCQSGYCASGICSDNPCKNGKLDSLESDIDCGGACPVKCKIGQACTVTADCINGTSCVNNVCSATVDSDGDGVPDAIDNCPNTPPGEPVDEYGCSASQRHSCGDEIPDSWRILFFGDVLCEGEYAAEGDLDGDGITNLEEYLNGTDPTVSDSSFPWWIIIIIVLLILIAVGVWFYHKKPEEFKRRIQQIRRSLPSLPMFNKPEAPAPPKKEEAAPAHLEDWLSMSDLKKLGPEDVSAKTFSKLDAFIKGKLAEKEHPKLLKQLEQEETPLDRLRELALAGLSPAERKALLLKLRLLRRGKLTKEEMEALFRKLRITAAYYETHKNELEAELEAFVRGEKRKRRR
jgi:hypothetical protein